MESLPRRHERLDTLCGSEFEGFRGVPCGRDNCELNVNNNRSEWKVSPVRNIPDNKARSTFFAIFLPF